MASKALSAMRKCYPFPKTRPDFKPFYWALDGGGRDLIIERAKKAKVRVIVEVGVFVGGSVHRWLTDLPNVIVIGIDPWDWDCATYFEQTRELYRYTTDLKGMTGEELAAQMRRPQAMHLATLSNLWDFRDRSYRLGISHRKSYTPFTNWD